MSTTMAKRKTKPESSEAAPVDEKSWSVFARIDPALRKPVEDYVASQTYPPHIGRVLERALRMLLESEGYWPPRE